MFTFNEATEEFEQFNNRSKNLVADIISDLTPKQEGKKLTAMAGLYDEPESANSLYVLKEGNLKFERDNRLLFVYDEGDLLGIEQMFLKSNGKAYSEFGSTLDEYDKSDFLKRIASDPKLTEAWTELLAAQLNLYGTLYSSALKEEVKQEAKFKSFQAEEVIIEQDTTGKEVYIMLEGHAEVFVKGTRVGEVLQDEIFGAFAAITNTPRTATVKATMPSTVLVMTMDNFRDLLETRPNAVIKLVHNMARIIIEQNQRVIQLTGGQVQPAQQEEPAQDEQQHKIETKIPGKN